MARELEKQLLSNIRENLAELEELLVEVSGHWEMEDMVYRYYHGSFKVYFVQRLTTKIVKALEAVSPELPLSPNFLDIVQQGTGKTFEMSHNKEWDKHTLPLLQAFFHAKFFLEMAIKYGQQPEPPEMLPSGYAALLYLYGLR